MSVEMILQFLQTASVMLAMAVAVGTLRGRGSEKTAVLTKMQVDIEYIKQRIDGVDKQAGKLVELEACCRTLNRRIDDHLWLDHGGRKEGERE